MWVAVSPTRIPFSSSKSRTGRLMAPAGTLVGGGLSTAAVAEPAAPSVTARSSRTTIVPTPDGGGQEYDRQRPLKHRDDAADSPRDSLNNVCRDYYVKC